MMNSELNNISTGKAPKITVITVVYNSRQLLRNTILSVLNQTFKEWEYVIIDGGSNDGTIDIIKDYSRFLAFWVSEKDKGIYDAMNKGLKAARGEYVLFLNSGDLLADERVLEGVFSNNIEEDCYYGETLLIEESGKILGTRSDLTTRKLPTVLTWKDMINGMVVSHQSIIFRREIVKEYNLNFRCSADIDWVIRGLKSSANILNTGIPISKYLVGGFSIKNQKVCLKERWKIYVMHYGIIRTIYAHLILLIKNIGFTLKGKTNY
ncbi:MAG: glycosyltransferase family 2 protein [Cytophagaceae bacterium]